MQLLIKKPNQAPPPSNERKSSLPVSTPGDLFEQEADRLADRIDQPERGAEHSHTRAASSGIGVPNAAHEVPSR
jgi:hypothetical protein